MKNDSTKIAHAVAIAALLLLVTNPELRALLLVLQAIGTEIALLWLVVALRSHMAWFVINVKTLHYPISKAVTLVVHFVAAQAYLRPFIAVHNLLFPALLARLSAQPAIRTEA